MSDIVWADPPQSKTGRGGGNAFAFVERLKERPGEWAIYPHTKGCAAGHYKASYPGTEWVTRKGVVYARWVGP